MANTLTHTLVNSGTAVILQNSKVTYGWKNLNEVKPIPGKFDIVENNNNGFENPKITISGYFDDIESPASNELTQKLLIDFATLQSTGAISLSVPVGAGSTYLGGRPSGGYANDGTNTLQNTISVVIDSFIINVDGTSSDRGTFWSYSITLHETA